MAHEYVTLADLKPLLNLADDDTTSDAALTTAIAAASRGIERTTGRRFWLDAVADQRIYNPRGRVLVDDGGARLLVNDIGSAAGLVVEIGSTGGGWSAIGDYETGPDNALADAVPITELIRPASIWGWGDTRTRIRVTARFGWPAVPEEVVQATQIQALRLYRRKDSPDGVTGSAEWGVVRLSRIDPDVAALIEKLTLPGIG